MVALHKLAAHTGGVAGLAMSPRGTWLASVGADATLRLWRGTGWQQALIAKDSTAPIRDVAWAPRTVARNSMLPEAVVATAHQSGQVVLWDPSSPFRVRIIRRLFGHSRECTCVRFSPNGEQLASAALDRDVRLWNVADGEPLMVLSGHSRGVLCLQFDCTGRRLVSAGLRGLLWGLR